MTAAKKPSVRKTARRTTTAAGSAGTAPRAAAAPPALDLSALLARLKLPGIDVTDLVESRHKDVQALLAANEQAYRGFEAVLRRQAEMLAEAMKNIDEGARETLATDGTKARVEHVGAQVKAAFGQALANMKELAELSARSQQQVVDTLNQRLREGLGEVGRRLSRAG